MQDREGDEFHRDYLCEMLEKQNELLEAIALLLASPITINVVTNGGPAIATTMNLTAGPPQPNQ
jgi:hypothetical protein